MKKPNEDVNPIVDSDNRQSNPQDSGTTNQTELPDSDTAESDPLAKLEAELSDARDKYLRLYSEFENFKKRMSRDRVEQSKMAGADVFLSILPVIDDLERAMKSIQEAKNMDAVKEGVQLIYSKLKSITDSKGLKPMDAVGKPFDPELHDAITSIPADETKPSGQVIEEIEKGYLFNDRVIRHAKVIVAK